MSCGAFRERITVWDRGTRQTETGFSDQQRTLVCAVRAGRSDGSTREIWEAYAAKTRNVVNFEIRPRQDIRAGMYVEWQGLMHEIIAVQRPRTAFGVMILKTKLEEAV